MLIARRYTLYTFLFLLVIALVYTPLRFVSDYRREVERVSDQILQINHSNLPFLVSSLWLTNYDHLQAQLDSIVQFPYVDRVEVVDDEGKLFFAAAKGKADSEKGQLTEHRETLMYTHRNTEIFVGDLVLYINTGRIKEDVLADSVPFLLQQLGSAAALAVFVSLLFHFMIGKHLVRFSDFMKNTDYTSLAEPFSFHRKKERDDELDLLAGAVNTMRLRLSKHISEKDLLLKEVHHRIKNNMASMQGLLRMQADTLDNPAAAEALKKAESRLASMGVLYDKIYRVGSVQAMPVRDYFPALLREIIRLHPGREEVVTETDLDDITLGAKVLSSLGILVNELVTNSLKHAFSGRKNGVISLVLHTPSSGRIEFIYRDNGPGIPDEVATGQSTGLGMMMIRTMAEHLDGTLRIDRQEGARVRLEFQT